jgi:hypothetical protein
LSKTEEEREQKGGSKIEYAIGAKHTVGAVLSTNLGIATPVGLCTDASTHEKELIINKTLPTRRE